MIKILNSSMIYKALIITVLCLLGLNSCAPTIDDYKINVKLSCNLPNFNRTESYQNTDYQIVEINTNRKYAVKSNQPDGKTQISLPNGFYKITVNGEVLYKSGNQQVSTKFSGILGQREISISTSSSININAFLTEKPKPSVGSFKNLLIKEICCSGAKDLSGRSYLWSSYFILHNNSDHIVYADSICLLESEFLSKKLSDISPDGIESQSFVTHLVYMVPGNGKEHPIAPGGDFIIADQAKNHLPLAPNTYDLSNGDFEWYEPGQGGRFVDEDNPNVPNMEKIYSYSRTFWIPTMQANRAFAIAKMMVSKEKFLSDYVVNYYSVFNIPGRDPIKREMTAYSIPNSWIADAVQTCPKSEIEDAFQMINPTLDRGYTYCHLTPRDKEGIGTSMLRIVDKTVDGITYYKDTNNSTDDFIPMSKPSLRK